MPPSVQSPSVQPFTVPGGPTVRPVRSRRERARFLDFFYRHYEGDRAFVPTLRVDTAKTLDPRKNAFFDHGELELFLAERDGRTVGRIAAIVNGMHLEKYADDVGFFGFFETVDDAEVVQALVEAAAGWLRAKGLRAMRGPVNPTMNDVAGLLVAGFDREPSILMPYNKPYYERRLVESGFHRAMTMYAYYVHEKYLDGAKLARGAEVVRRRNPGLRLRTLDMSRFMDEARLVMEIYNEAWSENWGHVPMTDREFDQLAKDLKQIIEPELVQILELDGQAVAFSVAVPNLNQAIKHLKNGRLFPLGLPKLLAYAKMGAVYETRVPLLGVRKAYQGRGLDAVMVQATIENGIRAGYDACEMSWVLESNGRLINALDAMNAVVDKTYGLFERAI